MLSPNLKHLQMMVNECELFGLKNGLKFNISKTQFIVSGTSPIPDVKVMFDNKSITPQMELKHLGFKWKINYAEKITLKKHLDSRISELGLHYHHLSPVASVKCTLTQYTPSTVL